MGLFKKIGKAFKSVAKPLSRAIEKVAVPLATVGAFGPAGTAAAAVVAPGRFAKTLGAVGVPGFAGQAQPSGAASLEALKSGLLPGGPGGFGTFAPQPVMGVRPPIRPAPKGAPRPVPPVGPAGAAAMGIPRWAIRFPNLWNTILRLRDLGVQMTPGKLLAMMRKVGPAAMIGLGFLTLDALFDLLLFEQTFKRRRMNVGNTGALRRALRRIEGFHRLCQRADVLRRGTPRRTKRAHPGGVQVVRAG